MPYVTAVEHFLGLFGVLRGLDVDPDPRLSVFEAARWLDALPGDVAPIAREADWRALDALSERIDPHLGVASRPASQALYEDAVRSLFATFDDLENTLDTQRYLTGDETPGPQDWWLFTHLVRHELVYYGLYKCNLARLVDYPNLYAYTRDLFVTPGVAETVDERAIVEAHFLARPDLEPKGVPPLSRGPDLWWPNGRAARFGGRGNVRGTEEAGAKRRPGEWVRKQSAHRARIGTDAHPVERGRYHLYVANNCPWSHRTVLARSVLNLTDVVSLDVLYYRRDPDRGWQFEPDVDGCTEDSLFGSKYLVEIYERVGSGEKSVPVLFDRVANAIVNNESAEIVRMFGTELAPLGRTRIDLYPEPHRAEIDELNAWTYVAINNGAYKAGFTSSQQAHADAYHRFFAALDRLEAHLASRRFLVGDALTEADLRLFPTIFRFDPVYYTRFRLDRTMVRDLPNLSRWLDTMLALPGVREASNLEHCKNGYFGRTGNGIVPIGPRRVAR